MYHSIVVYDLTIFFLRNPNAPEYKDLVMVELSVTSFELCFCSVPTLRETTFVSKFVHIHTTHTHRKEAFKCFKSYYKNILLRSFFFQ